MQTTTTRALTAAVALAIGLTLAGCSTNNTSNSDTSSSESSSSESSSSTASHNDQDVLFTQQMLPHHQQAIEMSDMLLAKGSGVQADVVTLAKQIEAEQAPEIKTMTGWLTAWNEPTQMPSKSGMDHSSMSGMMSDSDMQDLQNASPRDAGKLYLEQMIQHHTSAVDMAKSEVTKGKNADTVALAKSIVQSQTEQITQMQDMLASK
ncbi:uncharacterized protein (DUF305 family) [Curtobacterium luteum]|uniref:DUF305 domain-containing protein n=1 Tax=Curtobacterium luteum TaxID=33881 RepID=A0A8H9GE07_9MICO|nr:DUF305 domain-containing protein [Curtobacterium luteum]MBM7803340.1 uncharacterized protein (DUF305 family) [Curtobacterium luteum]NUU51627.1 DUF305 domain-containing protein [Curtobacterium luteum]GGL07960.1 DUF305 domain-containing protein [Curtobacterium luteum]